MKQLVILITFLCIVSITMGRVTLEVRDPYGETPFDPNNGVMTGAELTIFISSDSNDYWSGGLFIAGQDRAFGTLAGRGYDPNRLMYDPNRSSYGITQFVKDWTGSHFENAGESAIVTDWEDSSIWGFDLYTTDINDNNFLAGDWFIIDYKAEEIGDCNVGFYDYSISWDEPQSYIKFSNVPTRNLDSDPNQQVNFVDYAVFSSQWSNSNCNDPDWCAGADLDRDGDIDHNDLSLFVEYWLWLNPKTVMMGKSYRMDSGSQKSYTQTIQQPNLSVQVTQDIQPVQEIDINKLVNFLEEMWIHNEELRETVSEAELQAFIDGMKNYQE